MARKLLLLDIAFKVNQMVFISALFQNLGVTLEIISSSDYFSVIR